MGIITKLRKVIVFMNVSLLIVEDNLGLSRSLNNFFSKDRTIDVVGCASNVLEAEEMVKLLNPDAILLDVIMPGSDGFNLIEKINKMDLKKAPQIIMYSSIGHDAIIKKAALMGVRYFMVKPLDMDILKSRILELFNPISDTADTRTYPQKSLDEKITNIFLTIGIPAHIKGFTYLREAIRVVYKQPDIINSITKQLYPTVAEIFNTSPSKVERAIRHAIEVAWTRGKIENINGIFGFKIYSRNDKPTNGEFIALIADRLIMDKSA